MHILGFTKEVHRLMRAADFLIGKPGPGSMAEAMVRQTARDSGMQFLDSSARAL